MSKVSISKANVNFKFEVSEYYIKIRLLSCFSWLSVRNRPVLSSIIFGFLSYGKRQLYKHFHGRHTEPYTTALYKIHNISIYYRENEWKYWFSFILSLSQLNTSANKSSRIVLPLSEPFISYNAPIVCVCMCIFPFWNFGNRRAEFLAIFQITVQP